MSQHEIRALVSLWFLNAGQLAAPCEDGAHEYCGRTYFAHPPGEIRWRCSCACHGSAEALVRNLKEVQP